MTVWNWMKAMVNYIAIVGRTHPLAIGFLLWVSKNTDPQKYNVNCDPNWQREDAQVTPYFEREKGEHRGT